MDHTTFNIIAIVASYFIGSIPFGLIIAKYFGAGDIRQMGSGNIGATNVVRTSGKKLGIITLLLDAGKGVCCVLAVRYFDNTNMLAIVLAASFSVIGHCFPVWLKFKGGKGVATTIAVYWAVSWPLGLFVSGAWLFIFSVSRIVSVSSIMSLALAPSLTVIFASTEIFLMSLGLCILVAIRHKENIERLFKGEELPVGESSSTSKYQ